MRWFARSAAVLVGVVVLSGCAVFDGTPTATQTATIGSVAVTFKVCASHGGTPTGSCTYEGNSGYTASYDPSQLWVGFRVPTGTDAPTTFTSSSTGPADTGPQLTFTQSAFYAGELQRLEPAAAGEEWVGFVSQYVDYSATSDQNFTATVDFGLPKGAGGAPFAGPFTYQAVVGGRQYGGSGTPDPNEPIDCQTSATSGFGGPGSAFDWICIDDQSPSTLGDDATLATRDAGVIGGSAVSSATGTSAKLPFTFDYAGAAPGAAFTFTGSTGLSGASATPSPGSFTPTGTSSAPVNVSVPVSATATPGTYKVTLTATLPDGETRTGTDTLTVLAPTCTVPKLKGDTIGKAKTALTKAGCKLGAVSHRHSSTKKGKILAQSPGAGKTVATGTRIAVATSIGPEPKSKPASKPSFTG